MSEVQMAHFSFGGESPDRSRFHEIALRDARVTTDHHEPASRAVASAGLLARLGLTARVRVAVAGGPATTEACSCPA